MARELRGTRYLYGDKQRELAAVIEKDLFFLDYRQTLAWYDQNVPMGREVSPGVYDVRAPNSCLALLGCNDRFFLLTRLLHRRDVEHPWLFDRCREVELEPDGHIDLWARFHYKSTIITFAGVIQEMLCDPEITIAIFSVVKQIAQAFLAQIKEELENNQVLKDVYADVLYKNPRSLGSDGRPSHWGVGTGLTIKRKTNPKEATVEAHGLIDGQPTSRHFRLHVYDDVVTQDYLSEDSIKKTTERWELADNLGSHEGVRKWMPGTRYHYADTYSVVLERGSLIKRQYAATDDGTLAGKPVFLSEARWAQVKNDQRSTVSAQMLLNPIAGTEATFKAQWLRWYEVIPAVLNVYILVDPSKGSTRRSDRTAIAVVGVDQGGSKYLLDGVRHRMKLSERWEWIKTFKAKWEKHPGVQMVRVGYERYGQQVDLEVIEDMMIRENNHFEIVELNTPRQGLHSKDDRIGRLEPDIRIGRFYLPSAIWNSDVGPPSEHECLWMVWTEEHEARAKANAVEHGHFVGQVLYRPRTGLTKLQRTCAAAAQKYRIVDALKRRDENGEIYDLTRVFIDEAIRHPFAAHDDLIDAVSRIYDIDPMPPVAYEGRSTEPLGLDTDEMQGMEDDVVHYDDGAGSMGNPF